MKLVWFSRGAPSAVVSKMAVQKYGDDCEVIYCKVDNEHEDNMRFLKDVQTWIGKEIKVLKSEKYKDIYDVFDKTGWLVGPGGARCSAELKKSLRLAYQKPGDIHLWGYTLEESIIKGQDGKTRLERFKMNNPEIKSEFPLIEAGLKKNECLAIINKVGIEIPEMYRLGFRNNNCIGCVKGQQGYWNKIRKVFPEAFEKMAKQERKMDVAINKKYVGKKRFRVFLDELDPNAGNYDTEPDISCGVVCSIEYEKLKTTEELQERY